MFTALEGHRCTCECRLCAEKNPDKFYLLIHLIAVHNVHNIKTMHNSFSECNHRDEVEKLTCRKCNFKSKTWDDLMVHECEYPCKLCQRKFNESLLKNHLLHEHRVQPDKIKMMYCEEYLYQERVIVCETCGDQFVKIRDFLEHRNHGCPPSCKICNNQFQTKFNLDLHNLNTHNLCECGEVLINNSCQKCQNKRMQEILNFRCVICGVSFQSKDKRKLHSCKCEKCGIDLNSFEYIIHFCNKCGYCLQDVVDNEIYTHKCTGFHLKCQICGQIYVLKHRFVKHIEKKHVQLKAFIKAVVRR